MAKAILSDLDIAQSAKIDHINNIAKKINVSVDDLEHYGKYKAKLPLTLINEEKIKKAKLVLVNYIITSFSGTPLIISTTSIAFVGLHPA